MKGLWRRIGKKSLRLSRRSGSTENGCGGGAAAEQQAVKEAPAVQVKGPLVEDTTERSPEKDEKAALPCITRTMDPVLTQATSSFDQVIPEEEEEEEEELDEDTEEEEEDEAKQEGPEPVSLAPATSEENLEDDGMASYSYGSQFAFHAGLYGYPVAVVHRRRAAVPVIKGYTMTDVDFPLYFSSYDIPVVSASRHASFTRRDRLVRLHNRYTSMPAMRTERPMARASTLAAAGGNSAVKVAPPSEDDVNGKMP